MKIKKVNEMNKLKFLYFEDQNDNSTNIAYSPGEFFLGYDDGTIIKCEIVNGNLKLSVDYNISEIPNSQTVAQFKKDVKELNKILSHTNVDNWEYFDFYSKPEKVWTDDPDLTLIEDK